MPIEAIFKPSNIQIGLKNNLDKKRTTFNTNKIKGLLYHKDLMDKVKDRQYSKVYNRILKKIHKIKKF
jgi:hypothetical protein